jgi:microcompartment protein CcmL/EutN
MRLGVYVVELKGFYWREPLVRTDAQVNACTLGAYFRSDHVLARSNEKIEPAIEKKRNKRTTYMRAACVRPRTEKQKKKTGHTRARTNLHLLNLITTTRVHAWRILGSCL